MLAGFVVMVAPAMTLALVVAGVEFFQNGWSETPASFALTGIFSLLAMSVVSPILIAPGWWVLHRTDAHPIAYWILGAIIGGALPFVAGMVEIIGGLSPALIVSLCAALVLATSMGGAWRVAYGSPKRSFRADQPRQRPTD